MPIHIYIKEYIYIYIYIYIRYTHKRRDIHISAYTQIYAHIRYTHIYIYIYPLHSYGYLNKISIKTNLATDEGNSRSEM